MEPLPAGLDVAKGLCWVSPGPFSGDGFLDQTADSQWELHPMCTGVNLNPVPLQCGYGSALRPELFPLTPELIIMGIFAFNFKMSLTLPQILFFNLIEM